MMVTVLQDAYRRGGTRELADAIEYLCSPKDPLYWTSAGIYCFWDITTRTILYVGLATDLSVRFCQHNGLRQCVDRSCKRRQIEAYFENNEYLGYSVCVQSPMDQPIVSRNKHLMTSEEILREEEDDPNSITWAARKSIRLTEGVLIEICRRAHGEIPPWNKVAGAKIVYHLIPANYGRFYESLAGGDSASVARSTIRELSENPTLAFHECEILHACRMSLAMHSDIDEQIFGEHLGSYKDIPSDVLEAGAMHNASVAMLPFVFSCQGNIRDGLDWLQLCCEDYARYYTSRIRDMDARRYWDRPSPFSHR